MCCVWCIFLIIRTALHMHIPYSGQIFRMVQIFTFFTERSAAVKKRTAKFLMGGDIRWRHGMWVMPQDHPLLPVGMYKIVPFFLRNNEQIVNIFLGTWPTVVSSFTSAQQQQKDRQHWMVLFDNVALHRLWGPDTSVNVLASDHRLYAKSRLNHDRLCGWHFVYTSNRLY